MRDKKLLLIFIKNPRKGTVKTRLAKTVGDEKAYQVYLKLLKHTLSVAAKVKAERQIWYSSFIEEVDGFGEEPSDRSKRSDGSDIQFKKKLQRGGDLGERMANAFKQGFEDELEKIIIIGSDCPGITPQIIEEGFEKLEQNDVVIGPSEDGGYYLIGSNTFIPEIFDGIPWSTENVYSETINLLQKKNLHYSTLLTLNDIDTEADLRNSGFE